MTALAPEWQQALTLVMLSRTHDLPRPTRISLAAAAIHDAGDHLALTCALADMAASIVAGAERAIDRLLANDTLMARALVTATDGHPLTAADVGLDAAAILARIGQVAAGT